MKPNFALSLSFDGIRLLHRAAGGWHLVGEVSVTDPNLSGALAGLLEAGKAVKTRKLRTKLIIPDEQIKYLTIDTPDMDDGARRAAARAALDGATPYPVDALAFDISPDGARTHVAAVARETLLEAEAFASEHGFHPVSFVAAAEGSEFLGEPFFGPTAHSRAILANGAEVKPDGVRVVIVDNPAEDDATNSPAARADSPPPSADETTPSKERAASDEARAAFDPVVSPVSAAEPDGGADAQPTPVSQDAPDVAAQAPPITATAPSAHDMTAPPRPSEPTTDTDPSAKTAPPTVGDAPLAPSIAAEKSATPLDAEPIAALQDTPEDQDDPKDPEAEVTTPPLLGFATRRRQDPSSTAAPARLGGVSRDAPPLRTTPPVSAPTSPAATTPPPAAPSISLTTPPKSAADSLRPTLPPVHAPAPAPADIADAAPVATAKQSKLRAGGFLSRRKPAPMADAAGVTPGGRAAAKSKRGAKNAAETERMTVFGARDGDVVGGKPRFLGLILMAILLVFLAGVAAWATVFMDDGLARLFQGRERTLASTLPDDARDTLAQDVGATTQLPPDDEEIADGVVVAALNDSLSGDGLSAEDAAVLDALRDPLPDPVAPEELDAAALEARYAVTGIWSQAPEMATPATLIDIEDLYVTGIDPVSPALDAVALPTLASLQTDRQLALVTSPVAAGTQFARGLDGRLIPTPEGALSPDGFTVFLGRPPLVPPATLVRLETGPGINPDVTALAQVRPRPRPSDLVEQNERATLGGLSRTELAGLRPRLRPQAPQEVEEDSRPEAPEAEDAPPSPLAAAVSLRPETRPRNFQRIVARAQPRTPDPAPTEQRTASVAPRAVAPSIPSTASVAREATVRNAINLRQVNLIGVYGTPSNRRALVRLSNGRYQKVEVGDRFDGGRVSAIGDGELRYQKGNRNLILKMPQG